MKFCFKSSFFTHKMLGYNIRIFILITLEIIFVKCAIPSSSTLSVRQVDSNVIARKRMDTLEMCRIFENERLKQNSQTFGGKRYKREIAGPKFGGVPTLREEDVRRVESIVDKLYDDLTENGKPVTYRQREIKATTKIEKLNEELFNHSSRRFDFAPAFLLGPEPARAANYPPETVPVPWIKKWKHAIIPYFIDPKTYDSGLAETITSAFDYFERATCIRLQRLREKPTDQQSMEKVEWVYISNPMGIRQCVHSNEWIPNKGVQMVVFGYDCMSTGEIVHEVMHILGFSHEHNRPDRDQHVAIMWDNIKPGYKKYFERRTSDVLQRLPYDYASVLHYPPRAFSKNGQITVSAKIGIKLGQREGLSETDVEKVALIFGNECVDRNKDYLLTTCPSVVKTKRKTQVATQNEIQHYFKDRIWKYGIVNYKLKNKMEFSTEEKENLRSVIKHIEKETCIEFRDMNEVAENDDDNGDGDDEDKDYDQGKNLDKNEDNIEDGGTSEKGEEDSKKKLSQSKPKAEDNTIIDAAEQVIDESTQNPPIQPEAKDTDAAEQVTDESTQKPPIQPEDNDTESTTSKQENGAIVSLEVDAPVVDDPAETTSANSALRSKSKNKLKYNARVKRSPKLSNPSAQGRRSAVPSRRHADSYLVFTRSTEPGCKCPAPGKPQEGSDSETIELNADCFNSVNDLLHVFVHILGLDHQHNMHDRDDFLHIVWDKLTPEVKKEMQEKLPAAAAIGFPYDYQSVMHYPWLQIKNGVTNIMYPIWNDGWAMGHWQGLSSTDVQKLSLLYFEQCLERKKQEAEHEKDQ